MWRSIVTNGSRSAHKPRGKIELQFTVSDVLLRFNVVSVSLLLKSISNPMWLKLESHDACPHLVLCIYLNTIHRFKFTTFWPPRITDLSLVINLCELNY